MKANLKNRIDILLVGIMILAIFLNFYNIGDSGSNTYYTAAAKSMTANFKAFFFASLDPAGFITVDKPPVALWFQAISAAIFGVSDWSVLLPEAIAGVLSVLFIYYIVKPLFGRATALWSSLILACTPIFVAVSRTNNVDSILIFVLLLATWAIMKSIDRQKISWLLLSVALVGIGFNIKMLQAYLVLPAFYLFYFLASRVSWKKRIVHLTAATVMLTAVSVSYAVAVDFIPEDERPYIGGSQTNSVLELAFGYNGIQRLTGENRSGDGGNSSNQNAPLLRQDGQQNDGNTGNQGAADGQQIDGNLANQGPQQFTRDGQQQSSSSRGAGGENIGEAGPFRLFSDALSGQIAWLLPFVLFSVIGVIISIGKQMALKLKHKFALFWLAWLVPMTGFFSIASFYHRYYLSMMGPAIAALVAIGGTVLWEFYKQKQGWSQWLLPGAMLVTFAFEAYILAQNSIGMGWILFTALLGIIVFALMAAFKNKEQAAHYTRIAGMLGLLIMPVYWALTPVLNGVNTVMPVAGPITNSGPSGFGGPGAARQAFAPHGSSIEAADRTEMPEASQVTQGSALAGPPGGMGAMSGRMGGETNSALIEYLENNYDGEKYLVATINANSAAQIMLKSDKAVMAMGGFTGSDPALTPEKLEKMVKNGEVKYFLLSGGGMGGNSELTKWIQENSVQVPQDEWQPDTTADDQQTSTDQQQSPFGTGTLYKYEG